MQTNDHGSDRPFYCDMKATSKDPWPIRTLQLERVWNTVENTSHDAGGETEPDLPEGAR